MPATDKRQWYKLITAKANGGKKTATVHIYDEIGMSFFGGVDAGELVAEIEALDDDTELTVRINSPGGAAFDGLNIANAIMRHKGTTSTHIDGLAASAASLVALAGETVVMSKYGQMMLHNARGAVYGSAADMRTCAKVLDKLNGSMADFYADRAGGEPGDWARAMSRESWYNADEALEAGLVTELDESTTRDVTEQETAKAMARATAPFIYPGRQAAPPPTARADGPDGPEKQEGKVPLSEKVAERLGLGTDASDDDVLGKLDELGKPADPPAADPPAADPGVPGPVEELAAKAKDLGLTLMDPGRVEALINDAALGRAAHEELERRRHAALLDDALDKGKIAPHQRDHFALLLKADEKGTAKILADIPPEMVAPLHEQGHAVDPIAAADDVTKDPRYMAWKF